MPIKNREKQRAAQRSWYQKHRERLIKQQNAKKRRRREMIKELKENTPCADCKKKYPYYVMDFDHREATSKRAIISRIVHDAGMSGIKEEISKCDLVCSNCHRERTHQRFLYKKSGDVLPHSEKVRQK